MAPLPMLLAGARRRRSLSSLWLQRAARAKARVPRRLAWGADGPVARSWSVASEGQPVCSSLSAAARSPPPGARWESGFLVLRGGRRQRTFSGRT